MSNAKTGGNKKSSSQSDLNYWARAKASNYASTHADKRVKKHKKAHPKDRTTIGAKIEFPKVAQKRPVERMVMLGNMVGEHRIFDDFGHVVKYPHMVIHNGVVTDVIMRK